MGMNKTGEVKANVTYCDICPSGSPKVAVVITGSHAYCQECSKSSEFKQAESSKGISLNEFVRASKRLFSVTEVTADDDQNVSN